MKKLVFTMLMLIGCFLFGYAEEVSKEPILVRAHVGYGYNYTHLHHGLVGVRADFPLNKYVELDAELEENTANIFSIGTNLRPKFPLPVGEMFAETKLLYKAVSRDELHDFNFGLSLGYRMDYVSVQVGLFTHMMSEFGRNWHSENEILTEPISMLYKLNVFVRPQDCVWNLNLGFANFDDYQVERFWQPIFFLGGRYNLNDRTRLWADVECKPTGMFHLDASFYGIQAKLGLGWTF